MLYYQILCCVLLLLFVRSYQKPNNYLFLCENNKVVDVNLYFKEKHNVTNVYYNDKLFAKFKYDVNDEETYLYFNNYYLISTFIKNNCNLLPFVLSFYSDDGNYRILSYRYFQQLDLDKIYYNYVGHHHLLQKYNNNWNITIQKCNSPFDEMVNPFIATIMIDKIC